MNNDVAWDSFSTEVNSEKFNLAKASLYYAKAEYPNLDIDYYISVLDKIGAKVRERLGSTKYPLKVIKVINDYLFEELNFSGNEVDYYDPKNSFLNDVIDRQTGIPITLSVIYLEIAKRINFPMVGIGMPGHFLISPDFEDSEIFVDVFNKGEILFKEDCQDKLSQIYQQNIKLESHFLSPVSNRQILQRMLTNLKQIFLYRRDFDRVIKIITGILILFPNKANELRDRGLIYYQLNKWSLAKKDLQSYLNVFPNAEDSLAIELLLKKINN